MFAFHRQAIRVGALILTVTLGACTPYAVHTSARPLAEGERSRTVMMTVVPAGIRDDSSHSLAMPGVDIEQRMGLDDRSDLGVRINALSGAIVSYKRRLDGPSTSPASATALLVGGGFVNWGQHAHLEATLLRSGNAQGAKVPYGGVRIVQVLPMSSAAPSDRPTVGAFGGTRFQARDGSISLELGVFYDRSALGLRKNDVVVVPSIAWSRGRRQREDK